MSTYAFIDESGETRLQGSLRPDPGSIQTATKTLTNAQVKALGHPTPVTLVAAPGSGYALVPVFASLRLTWAADYTGIDPDAVINVNIGVSLALAQLIETTRGDVSALLAGGEDASAFMPANAAVNVSPTLKGISGLFDSDIENKALTLSADNGTLATDFTGGNAGNSLKVTLLYFTMTF